MTFVVKENDGLKGNNQIGSLHISVQSHIGKATTSLQNVWQFNLHSSAHILLGYEGSTVGRAVEVTNPREWLQPRSSFYRIAPSSWCYETFLEEIE